MLTDLQTKKLTRYFQVYDIDDDGAIEASDFERIVENVRMLHGEDGNGQDELSGAYRELWTRIAGADGDGDGAVDLDEWLAYWQVALESDERFSEEVAGLTHRLFTVFDLDEDDVIGRSEFADFFGVFGLSVDLAESVFDALDTNDDSSITRDELLQASSEFFRSDDVESGGNMLYGPYGA